MPVRPRGARAWKNSWRWRRRIRRVRHRGGTGNLGSSDLLALSAKHLPARADITTVTRFLHRT